MHQDGSVHVHAQWPHGLTCCLLLAETAPEAVTRALQGPVQEALHHGQDEDRARTCAAAEALSGLLASRTAFEVPPGELMHLSVTNHYSICSMCARSILSSALHLGSQVLLSLGLGHVQETADSCCEACLVTQEWSVSLAVFLQAQVAVLGTAG